MWKTISPGTNTCWQYVKIAIIQPKFFVDFAEYIQEECCLEKCKESQPCNQTSNFVCIHSRGMGIVWSFNLSNCSREVGLLSCVLMFKHLYSLAPNYLYNDVTIVCSTVCSGADERKHKSSASLVFVRGIHRWPVVSPHKGLVTRKMFPFDDVIMINEAMVLCFGNYQFKHSYRVNWNPSHFVHSTVYTLYLLTWRIQSSAVLTRSNITRYNTQQCLIASEHKPDFELTTDIPYLALTGEQCIYCQDLEENVAMAVGFKTGECEIKHDPGITR